MTVSTTIRKNTYTGNGSTTNFTYAFKIDSTAGLSVLVTSIASTVETALTETTHYTVYGAGETNGGYIVVGDISAIVGEAILPSTYTITLYRDTAMTQTTDLSSQDTFSAETHEDVFDKLIMINQEQTETLDRCVKVAISSSTDPDAYLDDITTAVTASQAAQSAAETAQTAAETAQTNAETAETNAETAETAAEAAQTAAEAAQTAAEAAQTAAEAAESNASDSETAAALSESNASDSETAAALSESNASDSETAAAASETAAAASETAAAASESAAVAAANGVVPANGHSNYSINAAVASDALTITIKDKDGSDLSSENPAIFSVRDNTVTTGHYDAVELEANSSLTISTGSTLGHRSGKEDTINVYMINDAGSLYVGGCQDFLDCSEVHSSTAEGGAGGADSATTLYSAAAHTSCGITFIGSIQSTQTSAGTWRDAVSNVYCGDRGMRHELFRPVVHKRQAATNENTNNVYEDVFSSDIPDVYTYTGMAHVELDFEALKDHGDDTMDMRIYINGSVYQLYNNEPFTATGTYYDFSTFYTYTSGLNSGMVPNTVTLEFRVDGQETGVTVKNIRLKITGM